jgi:hypothetical protein
MLQLLQYTDEYFHPYFDQLNTASLYHPNLHVQGIKTCLSYHSESVVLLEKQLTSRVEADSVIRQAILDIERAFDNQSHRFVPGSSFKLPITPDLRVSQTIRMIQAFPSMLPLRRKLLIGNSRLTNRGPSVLAGPC